MGHRGGHPTTTRKTTAREEEKEPQQTDRRRKKRCQLNEKQSESSTDTDKASRAKERKNAGRVRFKYGSRERERITGGGEEAVGRRERTKWKRGRRSGSGLVRGEGGAVTLASRWYLHMLKSGKIDKLQLVVLQHRRKTLIGSL